MIKSYARHILSATTIAIALAACGTEPESLPDAPGYTAETSSGGTQCGPGSTSLVCYVGTYPDTTQGTCALSPMTGSAVCCTGCVDSKGYCYTGTSTSACGVGGEVCAVCTRGNGCYQGTCKPYATTCSPLLGDLSTECTADKIGTTADPYPWCCSGTGPCAPPSSACVGMYGSWTTNTYGTYPTAWCCPSPAP